MRVRARLVQVACWGMVVAGTLAQEEIPIETPGPAVAGPENAPGQRIVGRVVDEKGQPIRGAAVAPWNGAAFVDTAALLAAPVTTSGADGGFELTAAAGTHAVVVAAPGRQSAAVWARMPGADCGEISLPPGVRLAGRVRDGAGRPIPGARVRVQDAWEIWRFVVPGRGSPMRLCAGTATDERGVFVLPGVPANGLRLFVEAEAYLPERRVVAHSSPLDLELRHVGVVRGRVVGAAGEPLPGVRLHVLPMVPGGSPVTSGEDGSFAVTVPGPGPFRLQATAAAPPFATSVGEVLRGARDDVVLTLAAPVQPAEEERTVIAIDAATGRRLERFRLAAVACDPTRLQDVLLAAWPSLREFEGSARIRSVGGGVVVAADGYGFAVVPAGEGRTELLQAELGPEAILTGTVVDAEDGKPLAGAAVRVLPRGGATGVRVFPEESWPRTNADGTFVMRGLRPGTYQAQVHVADRIASEAVVTTLEAGANTLTLTAQARLWLDVTLRGTVPAGVVARLVVDEPGMVLRRHGLEHAITAVEVPVALRAGAQRLGPVGRGRHRLFARVSSATRVGADAEIELGAVDPAVGPQVIELPDLALRNIEGRVELPSTVPHERLAVVATARTGGVGRMPMGTRRFAAVGPGGGFVLEVTPGAFSLQLVDLETGIVFHHESSGMLLPTVRPLVLRPTIHWLQWECAPRQEGGEVVVHSIAYRLSGADPTGGPRTIATAGAQELATVPFAQGPGPFRWLVPEGRIELRAVQSFGVLHAGRGGPRVVSGAPAVCVEVTDAVHDARLLVEPTPRTLLQNR